MVGRGPQLDEDGIVTEQNSTDFGTYDKKEEDVIKNEQAPMQEKPIHD